MRAWKYFTVTDQAGSPDSPLSLFLAEVLPDRHVVVDDWWRLLRRAPAAGVALDQHWDVVGKAFEMRVGLDLADTPGYWQLLAFLPSFECQGLLRAAGFGDPDCDGPKVELDPLLQTWSRVSHPIRPDDPDQARALSGCFDAVCWDGLAHTAGDKLTVEQCRRGFALIPGPSADHRKTAGSTSPLLGLLHLWDSYLRYGRRQLLELGDRVVLQPLLAPGFAEADLVVGRTIVDVKTYLDPRPYLEAWLDQLLAYVLLDRWNIFYLTDVAVFAGWQATLCRSSIDSVLRAGSRRESPSVDELREEFHETMQLELGQALRSHMHRQYPPPDDAWVSIEETAE